VDDTPFVNDGADTSLRKAVSLLNKIEAKTGSTTITGPVTVSNEVEVTNSTGNPIPVSGTVTANTGLTQPLTDAQLRATAVPVNESLIVNQGSLFLYSSVGTYGTFDCGADADYVVFNRAGGGGGFTQKLEFSTTSDFATAYDTLSSSFAIFAEKYITNTGDLVSQEPTNALLSSNDSGSFVVNLRRLATYGGNENLKVRYVRVVVSGGGGGGFAGKFTSFRSKTSDAFNMNAAPHKTLISGAVDINSAKRPLPVTDNNGSLTVDGTVELGSTSLAALENISVTFPATQNVNVTNAGLNVSVTNLPATQPVSGSISVSNFPGTQPVSGTFWPTTQPVSGSVSVSNFPATQPVSIANPPVTPVTDNGGSLTIDGSITANQATAASLKAQAQLLNAAGSVVDYAMTGAAGTPATDVVTVQGIGGGTSIPISGTVNTYPQQGTTATNTNFSSITSAELAPASANREALTVYNEGAGTLFINVGASCSTTSYQVRLLAGDYWEAPQGQVSLQHSGIFGTSGTGRVTQVT